MIDSGVYPYRNIRLFEFLSTRVIERAIADLRGTRIKTPAADVGEFDGVAAERTEFRPAAPTHAALTAL